MSKNRQHTKPILDIAILSAGRSDLLKNCIESILPEMKPEYRIQLCNNGHPSSEYEAIYKLLPEGSIIRRNNTDNGFSVGANTTMKAGNAPLILFVTDDVSLNSGTIDKLIRTMDAPSIGQCGLKLLFPLDSTDPNRPAGKVQHIGMASTVKGDMVHPLVGWSSDNPKCNISREVLAVTGACFIIRRSIFQKIGGFSLLYGKGYYEDMDLSFSVRALGSRVYVNTEATAYHGVGQTFKNETTPAPIQKNQMIFKSRWFEVTPWSSWTML